MAYDFKQVENEVSSFWEKKKVYATAKKRGEKPFYFLDGPPYTSGRVHIGTAWNKSLKDCALRYKRMRGFHVWDRAGYDMHGFPISLKVRHKLGLKHMDDIKKFGVAKFVTECKKFALENMDLMNKDFQKLGVWMDFENAYHPVDKEFIEGEWWLIKQADKKKRLYQGEKVMHWCYDCTTSLSKHELEYEIVNDDSIFVKLPIVGKDKEFLVIWTTTPWTIPYNLAVMVNPDLEYVKVKVEGEVWVVASMLANVFISGVCDKKFKIIETMKGSELEGVEYTHPFADQIPIYQELKKESKNVHSVILSKEYVDVSAGSGLVHCAPGCGPEDYEVGRKYGIPPFNNLTEKGVFPDTMGKYSGWRAKLDDQKFIEALDKAGYLIAKTNVEHDYAHCWRCKNPVVYRTTKQWFFKVEDLKKRMLELHQKTKWVPDAAFNAFSAWINNLRDNGITRQMYWGTPVPIWQCDTCEDYDVIGSIAELKKKGKEPKDLHIPWIDEIKWKCKCGGTKKRIPDVLDVWIDAGTTSWNCLGFPGSKKHFDKLFPADFILEGKDQIRGWFNLLLVASMVSMDKHSFKNVYMHGFIQDAQGRKMSKSLGNTISPYEIMDKYGSDTLRYYMITSSKPGLDMNYNFDDTDVKHRNLIVFWNLQNLIIETSKLLDHKPVKPKAKTMEDEYILSKLHSSIQKSTDLYDAYKLNEAPIVAEELMLELSRSYIQFNRERLATGSDDEKKNILNIMFEVYHKALIMLAPTIPFITEKIYQNIKHLGLEEESVHLCHWPTFEKKHIQPELEQEFELAEKVIAAGLSCRDQANLGVRWPLSNITISTKDESVKKAVEKLEELILSQLNIKEIIFEEMKVEHDIKPNYSALGKAFGQDTGQVAEIIKKGVSVEGGTYDGFEITPDMLEISIKVPEGYKMSSFSSTNVFLDLEVDESLEREGFVREIMRRTQNLRKRANLQKQDRIELVIETAESWLKEYEKEIAEKVGATSISITHETGEKFTFSSKEKIKGKVFNILLDKIE